jgi:hypothetical protein
MRNHPGSLRELWRLGKSGTLKSLRIRSSSKNGSLVPLHRGIIRFEHVVRATTADNASELENVLIHVAQLIKGTGAGHDTVQTAESEADQEIG